MIVLKEHDTKTATEGYKVKSVIQHVLSREQIKHLQKQNLWPMEFENSNETKRSSYTAEDILPDMEQEEHDIEEDDEEDDEVEGQHREQES